MRDLTQGSIRSHLIAMAMPITIGMLVQTLYLMVDLYFVSGIGKEAVAGVAAAGNVSMLVIALTQVLGVGTVSLVAHALGARDKPAASRVFEQSMLLGVACVAATLLLGVCIVPAYMRGVSADAAIAQAGVTFILWSLPGLALQFVLAVAGSVLRGAGIVKPGMVVQMATVGLNIVLAPVLIAGWGTHHPMGVAGAGLATSLSVAVGVLMLTRYLRQLGDVVSLSGGFAKPDRAILGRMLRIGLPSGGEFLIMVLLNTAIYALIRDFGASAQAGFGIAGRVMQALAMPSMAISFAIPAVAGQNFGGRRPERVADTLKQALMLELVLMAFVVLACQLWAPVPVHWFTADPLAIGAEGRLVELLRPGHRLRLLRHVPGDGQHPAGAGQLDDAPADLRATRAVAEPARRLPSAGRVAPVGGQRVPAGDREPGAGAEADGVAAGGHDAFRRRRRRPLKRRLGRQTLSNVAR